jgi:hypothetical protein
MKYLFYLLIFFTVFTVLTRADYLNTKDDNHCAVNVQPYQNHTGLCWHDQNRDHDDCQQSVYYKHLIDGYYYDADLGACLLKNDLSITSLTQDQWDYMLSILAHVMGFTMLFLVNFLSVLIVRK